MIRKLCDKIYENIVGIINPDNYELVCVGYSALSKNGGERICNFAYHTLGFRTEGGMLREISKLNELEMIFKEQGPENNKYFVMLKRPGMDMGNYDTKIQEKFANYFQESEDMARILEDQEINPDAEPWIIPEPHIL